MISWYSVCCHRSNSQRALPGEGSGAISDRVSLARAGLRQLLPAKVKALSVGHVFTAAGHTLWAIPLQDVTAPSWEQHAHVRMLSRIGAAHSASPTPALNHVTKYPTFHSPLWICEPPAFIAAALPYDNSIWNNNSSKALIYHLSEL